MLYLAGSDPNAPREMSHEMPAPPSTWLICDNALSDVLPGSDATATELLPGGGVMELLGNLLLHPTIKMVAAMIPAMIAFFINVRMMPNEKS